MTLSILILLPPSPKCWDYRYALLTEGVGLSQLCKSATDWNSVIFTYGPKASENLTMKDTVSYTTCLILCNYLYLFSRFDFFLSLCEWTWYWIAYTSFPKKNSIQKRLIKKTFWKDFTKKKWNEQRPEIHPIHVYIHTYICGCEYINYSDT